MEVVRCVGVRSQLLTFVGYSYVWVGLGHYRQISWFLLNRVTEGFLVTFEQCCTYFSLLLGRLDLKCLIAAVIIKVYLLVWKPYVVGGGVRCLLSIILDSAYLVYNLKRCLDLRWIELGQLWQLWTNRDPIRVVNACLLDWVFRSEFDLLLPLSLQLLWQLEFKLRLMYLDLLVNALGDLDVGSTMPVHWLLVKEDLDWVLHGLDGHLLLAQDRNVREWYLRKLLSVLAVVFVCFGARFVYINEHWLVNRLFDLDADCLRLNGVGNIILLRTLLTIDNLHNGIYCNIELSLWSALSLELESRWIFILVWKGVPVLVNGGLHCFDIQTVPLGKVLPWLQIVLNY